MLSIKHFFFQYFQSWLVAPGPSPILQLVSGFLTFKMSGLSISTHLNQLFPQYSEIVGWLLSCYRITWKDRCISTTVRARSLSLSIWSWPACLAWRCHCSPASRVLRKPRMTPPRSPSAESAWPGIHWLLSSWSAGSSLVCIFFVTTRLKGGRRTKGSRTHTHTLF